MKISKHHYALTLAARGNDVYFLGPPKSSINNQYFIETITENLKVIQHKLWFSYQLKFKARWLFTHLIKQHIQSLLKKLNVTFDIVWSFDLENLYGFGCFKQIPIKIFHPVDEPKNNISLKASYGADIMFATTNEILEKYKTTIPKYFINHGVQECFLQTTNTSFDNTKINIGISGNLLRNDIDREILLQIIKENSTIQFNFFGSYTTEQNNISYGINDDTKKFIAALKQLENVTLYGVQSTEKLVNEFSKQDAFLICYKVISDKTIGENLHKTLEYLSTGKVVISNNINAYNSYKDLLVLDSNTKNNKTLPNLFKTTISNLSYYNSQELSTRRVAVARDNTYKKQVERIEQLLTKHFNRVYEKFWKACEEGNIKFVRNNISQIKDINKYNDQGWNAIILASFNHHLEVVDFLLQNGANINSTNNNGTTVFMYAKTKVAENNNYAILDFLLLKGADINAKDTKNNWTVLDYVRQTNNQSLINYLITKGAQ